LDLSSTEIGRLIAAGESLTVEFKGESRRSLPDREVYENVVCLANTEGGVLLIGVEDDGSVTGARPRHGSTIEPHRLGAAIRNNTAPPIGTRASVHSVNGKDVVAVEVPQYREVCSTRDGRCLRRVLGSDGPQCVPFYPYEHAGRRSALGAVDYSAQLIEGATWKDLDPLETERLRQTIDRRGGDGVLLSLDDRQLAQALRLVETRDEELVPNVAGMLLLGREESLRRFVPACTVAYQVLGRTGEVIVNDWFHSPLLKTLEAIEGRFEARNTEKEVQEGFFRIPIPDYSPEAFREAINNAVLHRDYTRLDAVHVQFFPDRLFISNPGGFLEGITLDNLLVHEPKPRNPRLAEAFRRIGLVETTGRGIDKIYAGQLRYGRPLPDYGQSDRDGVRLNLIGGEASLAFATLVYRQNREGQPLSLDEMLALNHLQNERRADVQTVGRLIQQGEARARAVLERLVERGLVEARGERRARTYLLSASVYRELGSPAGYVRASGFDRIQRETMILQYVEAHGRITRRDTMELCNLGDNQASHLLRQMAADGKLRREGQKRGAYYVKG
jgi:ATP-dependent DNA helicase RecG